MMENAEMPTEKDIKKAIKGSIKKWEKIKDGKGIDETCNNCPLCHLFLNDRDSCEGCSVAVAVGRMGCIDTPYEKWDRHHVADHLEEAEYKILCSTCTQIVEEEIKFLKSLREKGD